MERDLWTTREQKLAAAMVFCRALFFTFCLPVIYFDFAAKIVCQGRTILKCEQTPAIMLLFKKFGSSRTHEEDMERSGLQRLPIIEDIRNRLGGIIRRERSKLACRNNCAEIPFYAKFFRSVDGKPIHCSIRVVLLICVLFLAYGVLTFSNITSFELFSKRVGTVLLMSYDICTLSHLSISLNRMCAICRPMQYNYYCNKHNTKILISVIWIVVIIRGCISYLYFDCDFHYDSSILAFVFSRTQDCQFISLHVDFAKDLFIVITVGIVDAITITVVQITNRRMRKEHHDIKTDKRRKREIKFLKQVVLQGILFSVELYTYFQLAWKFQNHWAVFAMTTVAWNLVHCGDAVINVTFNAEFRKLVASPKTIFRKKYPISNYSTTGPHAPPSFHH